MLIQILLAAGAIMLVSLIGKVFTYGIAKQFMEERLAYLVSFSAGVFLITAGALVLEVFEIFEGSVVTAIGLVLAGYGLAWVLQTLMPETHHHHGTDDSDCGHGTTGARKLLLGDAIHNVTDGILLVPAFLVSPALGLAVTVSIVIHETLQEISEFFVLKKFGYSTRRALFLNFLTSSTILIGVAISYFAVVSHELEGVLLAIAAGFFFHLVAHDLIPKRHNHESGKEFLNHVLLVLVGLVAMYGITTYLTEGHTHGEGEADHTDSHAHDEEVH